MKVVSPPSAGEPDPLLRLTRRALMEEARAELIKARLEKRRVAMLARRKRNTRPGIGSSALPAAKARRHSTD